MEDVLIDDIEDLMSNDHDEVVNERIERKFIFPKPERRKKIQSKNKLTSAIDDYQPPIGDSIISGSQKIYLKTWGCSHNNSDSEYMAGQLSAHGYLITDDKLLADMWLLNSCTVKNPSEDHFRNEIEQARKLNKHIVLAGCVPQGQPKSAYIQGLSIIGVQQIERIVEVVEETFKGHTVQLMQKKKIDGRKGGGASLSLPKIRKNPLVEIIAINTGCLNQCTYCKTKHARGELGSYSIDDIIERAVQSFKEGVVELWLTSEDLGAYGRDIGVSLPQLLWRLLEVVPEPCMVRLGMTNPPYISEHVEDICAILCHPRVYSFLHIPVQSGSDAVLTSMRREYSVEDFVKLVQYIKMKVPDVTIATDVICGFPAETEEDLKETLKLIEAFKFPSLFINQFFPRPGTLAAKMEKIPTTEVKRRTKIVSDLFNSYTTYDHKIGEVQDVLVTEHSTDGRYYVGHNKSYDQVLVGKDGDWMGRMMKVRITSTGKHFLMSQVLRPSSTTTITTKLMTAVTSSMITIKKKMKDIRFPPLSRFLKVSLLSLLTIALFKSEFYYRTWQCLKSWV
ncbi:hypothetical protein HELRODRAFT_157739 [Helobdella robusta]|uniref:tRNA-t(6)A37 methylthiotransferase n=1 Tax=Helobdella robusta TaxID=6412 RepID=T1EMF1_HELRO|nr:hypothetical protein HELRODRAFT_157739 [Helobdella robusta]ESN95062.1 hypothetical protein HELRODRAFT_157739 [Helobdella robusta]